MSGPVETFTAKVLDALAGLPVTVVDAISPDVAAVGPAITVGGQSATDYLGSCMWRLSVEVRVYPPSTTDRAGHLQLLDLTLQALGRAGLPCTFTSEFDMYGDPTLAVPVFVISVDT